MLDTGAHFYDVYKCSDGKFVSIGSIEPQFYAQLLQLTGLASDAEFANQQDRTIWPKLKQRLTDVFATKSQVQWCRLLPSTHRRGEHESKRASTCFLFPAGALLDDTTRNQIVNVFNTPRLQNFARIFAGCYRPM